MRQVSILIIRVLVFLLILLDFAADEDISKPSKELIQTVEEALKLLEKNSVDFMEALKAGTIHKDAWVFILNTDPWLRPRGTAVGTLILQDVNGSGLWIINGDREDQLNIQNNRTLGMDDIDLIKRAGGIYYSTCKIV
jgi:hypothetical protein